jgi:hypothetical protein
MAADALWAALLRRPYKACLSVPTQSRENDQLQRQIVRLEAQLKV